MWKLHISAHPFSAWIVSWSWDKEQSVQEMHERMVSVDIYIVSMAVTCFVMYVHIFQLYIINPSLKITMLHQRNPIQRKVVGQRRWCMNKQLPCLLKDLFKYWWQSSEAQGREEPTFLSSGMTCFYRRLSNVIPGDEKFTSIHQYLRYGHRCVTIVFSITRRHLVSLISYW